MLIFYIYSTIVTSLASGVLFYRKGVIKASGKAGFLLGLSLCPFVQTMLTLFLVVLFRNGVTRYVYILPLPVISTIYLLYIFVKGRKAFIPCISLIRGGFIKTVAEFRIIDWSLVILFIFSLSAWIWYCLRLSATSAFVYSDTMEYFCKASYFANHRTLSSLSYLYGIPNGMAVADHHFPSITAYLGYAFMHTREANIGFPYHVVPLCAYFILMPFLISAGMGLYYVYDDSLSHGLMIPFMMWTVNTFVIDVYNSPRDIYRFCAWFIFIAILDGYIDRMSDIGIKDFLGLLVISFATASAHLLNVVSVLLTLAAYIILQVFLIAGKAAKNNIKGMAVICLSCGTGTALAFAGNVRNFILSGKWYAVRMDFSVYDWYDEYLAAVNTSTEEVIPLVWRWKRTLFLSDSYVGLLILMFVIAGIIILIIDHRKHGWSKSNRHGAFFLLVTIIMFVPQSGLLDSDLIYRFSYNFAKVPRYALPFIMIGLLYTWYFISKISSWLKGKSSIYRIAVFAIIGFCICYFVGAGIKCIRYVYNDVIPDTYGSRDEVFLGRYGGVINAVSNMDEKRRILSQQQIGYALGEQTLIYSAPYAKPIYDASGTMEMADVFEDLNIGAVILINNDKKLSIMQTMPWYEYVTGFPKKELDNYIVYYVQEENDKR